MDSNGCLTTNDYGKNEMQLKRDQIIKENRELTGSYSIRVKQFLISIEGTFVYDTRESVEKLFSVVYFEEKIVPKDDVC